MRPYVIEWGAGQVESLFALRPSKELVVAEERNETDVWFLYIGVEFAELSKVAWAQIKKSL
jgi:hypothetical protein